MRWNGLRVPLVRGTVYASAAHLGDLRQEGGLVGWVGKAGAFGSGAAVPWTRQAVDALGPHIKHHALGLPGMHARPHSQTPRAWRLLPLRRVAVAVPALAPPSHTLPQTRPPGRRPPRGHCCRCPAACIRCMLLCLVRSPSQPLQPPFHLPQGAAPHVDVLPL